jgi:hypothetical protein
MNSFQNNQIQQSKGLKLLKIRINSKIWIQLIIFCNKLIVAMGGV